MNEGWTLIRSIKLSTVEAWHVKHLNVLLQRTTQAMFMIMSLDQFTAKGFRVTKSEESAPFDNERVQPL